jgi:hypothetical protein
MLKTNLHGQVRQTVLPKWKPLLPLFEAVINALQAVQDASKGAHKVVVEIERGSDLGLDDQPPITGFKVSDTGVGFNDENFDSFNTSFSEYKVARGGKGLGRFIWLKAFEYVEIDSVFTETSCCSARLFSIRTTIPTTLRQRHPTGSRLGPSSAWSGFESLTKASVRGPPIRSRSA